MTVSPMASATTSRPNLRPEPMIQSIDDDLLAGRTHWSPALVALRRTLSAPASEGHQRTVWCRPVPVSTPGLTHPRHQRLRPRAPPDTRPPTPRRDQLFTLSSELRSQETECDETP